MAKTSTNTTDRTLSAYTTFLKRELRKTIRARKLDRKKHKIRGEKFMVDYKDGEIAGLEFILWELQENII